MQNRYSIEIKNLKKSYDNGRSFAVNDISFNVEKGSLFAFLGMNGAGKSTTINIICSILEKDDGKIYINGQYSGNYTTTSYDNDNTRYNNGLYIGYSSANDVPLMSIGCIRYYHKALSEAEALQNYNHEQTINRVTTLNFPALDDSYENKDVPNPENPGEMNKKGGVTSE